MRNIISDNIKLYIHKKPYIIYILPAMSIMIMLSIFPTIFLLFISFTNYQLGWDLSQIKFVGFENFIRLFSGNDPDFWHSTIISLIFMLSASLIELILGLSIALMLNSTEFRLKSLVQGILIIPLAMAPSIAGLMWKLMYNSEYGIINYYLNLIFNIRIVWLSREMAIWALLFIDIWQYTPFVILILYSGIRSLPQEPYESAMIDGAGQFQIFIHITLPMLRKLLYLVLLFRMIDSLRLFDIVFVLTQGGPGRATELLSLHIFRMANAQNGLIGRAAAIAIVLMLLVTVISRILIKQQKKELIWS